MVQKGRWVLELGLWVTRFLARTLVELSTANEICSDLFFAALIHKIPEVIALFCQLIFFFRAFDRFALKGNFPEQLTLK